MSPSRGDATSYETMIKEWDPADSDRQADGALDAMVQAYIQDELEGAESKISIEFSRWSTGVEAVLSAEGNAAVCYVATFEEYDNQWFLVMSSSENSDEGAQVICSRF
jgi:hypothetical protein